MDQQNVNPDRVRRNGTGSGNNSGKKRKKKSRKARQIKGRIISFAVAVLLIIIVAYVAFAGRIKESIENGEELNARWFLALIYPEKYAYSGEMADMNEYFQLFSGDDIAIILQDERIDDRAKLINGKVYFSLDTVSKLFTKRFYYNDVEKNVLYTTSDSIMKIDLNDNKTGHYINGAYTDLQYVPAKLVGEDVYVCADYVKLYSNFTYDFYENPNRVQVYNVWNSRKEAEVVKNTRIRYQGGIKSEILTAVNKGDKVTVLETMENWSKVKTNDCFIGYIENNKLSEITEVTDTPASGAYIAREDYLKNVTNENIVLGWHQLFYADDGSNLNEILPQSACLNVVCPTWYYTNSEEGTFVSYANSAYVTNAHNKGMKVWALCEDMTNEFDEYALFSSSDNRKAFIDNLIESTLNAGADGINMDFEKIGKQTGPHYVQFLRELSIETRKNGLVLSVDNYQQNQGNLYYNLGEQGLVCDYVIIMDYDEHWAGSAEAGSVASIGFVENGITSAIEAGVPPYKLVNGMPFYTRLWRKEGDNLTSQAIGMNEAREWCNNRGINPGFDETTCQYYVSHQDGTATYEMWLEEEDSIKAKLGVCQTNNIAGVACWRLGLEKESIWPLIAEYYGN